MDIGQCKMASGVRTLNCADSEKTSELAPDSTRPRPGGSASFQALNLAVTTSQAGGRAGGAFPFRG
eukprot:13934693-Alexandrium_andersonii.AAC.1